MQAIAIDDEPIALEVIRNLSTKIPFISLNAVFTNGFEALEYLQKEKVDLLFLDIKMPDITGIELLQSIPNPPMVIFTTAYSEHAVQSFELDAIDYLLKPFSQSRFLKACNKAFEQFELRKNNTVSDSAPAHIFIKSGYDQIRIELEEILYVQSTGNYMQFVLPDRKIISRLTMNEVEELLPASAFVRIHRSYIVAKTKVHRVEKNAVWIKSEMLPVGSAYTNEIEKITKK
ncbi:MAG: response regulator transcription factor [Bacteroidetes bacterium]|nr:response regulator transcription factor [Bacteroidota bacterium]